MSIATIICIGLIILVGVAAIAWVILVGEAMVICTKFYGTPKGGTKIIRKGAR